MATGLGKTIVFAHVIERRPGRALVIAHRKELIHQAKDKIQLATGLECAVEMAESTVDVRELFKHRVIVGSVQTLNRGRMEKFDPNDFETIVCDEFHHGTSVSYRRIFDWFGRNPNLKILGVTATPDRGDQEALGQVCDSVAFKYDILEGVTDGWLVPVTQQFCRIRGLDLSRVHTIAGDFNEKELAAVMEEENQAHQIHQAVLEVSYGLEPGTLTGVQDWKAFLSQIHTPGFPRRAIVFTASVKQAEDCCNVLRRSLPSEEMVDFVCGKTPKFARDQMLSRFKYGVTSIICNCGVLTEGYDNPAVEVIFMARPTKSRALYTQMVGRSTRPLPGLVDGLANAEERKAAIEASDKKFCRIIDFKGNSGRHKLMTAFDVLSGKMSEQAIEEAKAAADGSPKKVIEAMNNAELRLQAKAERERKEREQRRRGRIYTSSEHEFVEVNPFGFGAAIPLFKDNKYVVPPTDAQKWKMGDMGVNPSWWLSRKMASQIIGWCVAAGNCIPSDKQWLRFPRKHK